MEEFYLFQGVIKYKIQNYLKLKISNCDIDLQVESDRNFEMTE